MPIRKYWIVVSFYLLCHTQLTSAKQLTDSDTILNDKVNNPVLSEDLAQQLSKKLPKSKFTLWLLNFLFKHPQTVLTSQTIASHAPYQGKYIGRIRLHKQGALITQNFRKQLFINILFPTTKDGVILKQLDFSSGDIIIPQQLIASQERLNACPHIKEAQIVVHKRIDNEDTVDVHIATKDLFPIGLDLDLKKPSLCINHNNMLGRGHLLKNKFFYNKGLGYSAIYEALNIKNSGVTGKLKYLTKPSKSVKKVKFFREATHLNDYAGKIEVSKTKRIKKRILDGNSLPELTSFSFCHQHFWLGTAFNDWLIKDSQHGYFFFTGKVACKQFINRPEVAQNVNRYFHNHVFGIGSVGFTNKKDYEDRLVYDVGSIEHILCGSKVNLIGGYQIGEFVNRPYLRLDMEQGGRILSLGYLYGAVKLGGFCYKKAVEQGIVQLKIDYFTPLLGIGNQWIRQFIGLDYLSGHNMFTGELISTNTHKVSKSFRDPFLGGTQRLYLRLETVLFISRQFAGCQVATLGFADAVKLQDAQGKVYQSSFCKALGIGFRCTHPHWTLGTLQVKLGYYPIVERVGLEVSFALRRKEHKKLDIDEPDTIPFQEY